MTRLRTLVFLALFPLTASALVGPAVPIGITEPRLGNGSDRLPFIATNGDQFFVVWEESRARSVVRGARIAADGTVLDPDGITISIDGNTPAVVWNGYAWAVTWHGGMSGSNPQNYPLMGQLYDTNGQPLGSPVNSSWSKFPQPILIASGGRIATVLHASDVFFMTPELYGVKDVLLTPFDGASSLASDGASFLFAVSTQTGIRLTRLDADGNILGTSTIAGHVTFGSLQLLWSGSRYWMAWIENGIAYAASVTADGVVSPPVAITSAPSTVLSLSALPNGDAVAYVNETGTIAVDLATSKATPISASLPRLATNARGDIIGVWTDGPVRIGHFRPDGTPAADGQFVVRTPSSSSAAGADPNGISPLVVFRVDRGPARDLVVRDPNSGATQVVASGSESFSGPAIAGNGPTNLTTWATCYFGACTAIDAALLSPNAAPKRIHIATQDNAGAQVVWTGAVYAVIWSGRPGLTTAPGPGLWMVRVSAAGDVLDSSPVFLASAPSGYATSHSVVSGDGVTLVTWDEELVNCNCRFANPHTIRALRLDANGNPIDSAPFALALTFTSGQNPSAPAAAWDGVEFAVVWNHAGIIDGVRVSPSGSVSPLLTSVVRTTAPPMIAANGHELFLAWGDMKNHVLTGTIDANGAVIDTGGVEAPFSPEWNVVLAHLGGDGMVLLSKEVLVDQTATIMMRKVDSGRPAAHRRP